MRKENKGKWHTQTQSQSSASRGIVIGENGGLRQLYRRTWWGGTHTIWETSQTE